MYSVINRFKHLPQARFYNRQQRKISEQSQMSSLGQFIVHQLRIKTIQKSKSGVAILTRMVWYLINHAFCCPHPLWQWTPQFLTGQSGAKSLRALKLPLHFFETFVQTTKEWDTPGRKRPANSSSNTPAMSVRQSYTLCSCSSCQMISGSPVGPQNYENNKLVFLREDWRKLIFK